MSKQKKEQIPVEEEVLQPNEVLQPTEEQQPEIDEMKIVDPNTDPNAELVVEESADLEAANEEIAKLKDAFLRAKAEEDNVRRRTEKEIANSRKFAVEGFAKEMMNVHDSLKLACSVELAEDADEAVKSMRDGVELTLKQLDSAFAKFALKLINPEAGGKLDPNLHQAMSLIESEEVESGCIISIIQPGFQLHDRLLRPALVVVAK